MNAVAEQTKQCRTAAELPFVAPEVNIYETEKSFVLQAELPGVNKSGLEVTLEGSTLTFTGRRSEAPVVGTPLYRETRPLNYRRSFELDPSGWCARRRVLRNSRKPGVDSVRCSRRSRRTAGRFGQDSSNIPRLIAGGLAAWGPGWPPREEKRREPLLEPLPMTRRSRNREPDC